MSDVVLWVETLSKTYWRLLVFAFAFTFKTKLKGTTDFIYFQNPYKMTNKKVHM